MQSFVLTFGNTARNEYIHGGDCPELWLQNLELVTFNLGVQKHWILLSLVALLETNVSIDDNKSVESLVKDNLAVQSDSFGLIVVPLVISLLMGWTALHLERKFFERKHFVFGGVLFESLRIFEVASVLK